MTIARVFRVSFTTVEKKSNQMTATQHTEYSVPILESGDRLTRYEFERRYQSMPHLKKAELIEGVVYVASPLRYSRHGQPHSEIMTWLGVYRAATVGIGLADNTTVRLDLDNEPQPDALLRIETDFGGQSRISLDDYVEGAPELIVEIASSSASYDLHDKLKAYRRNGVQEYIVWRVIDRQLDWFHLQAGEYIPCQPDESGVIFLAGSSLDCTCKWQHCWQGIWQEFWQRYRRELLRKRIRHS